MLQVRKFLNHATRKYLVQLCDDICMIKFVMLDNNIIYADKKYEH